MFISDGKLYLEGERMNREVFGFLILGIAMLFAFCIFCYAEASRSKSNDGSNDRSPKKENQDLLKSDFKS